MPEPADRRPIELDDEAFSLTAPDETPEQPERPGRTRRIVLGSLLAVGLAGAAALGVNAWRISSQKDATITAPSVVAGLSLDTSQQGRDTGDYLRTALSAEVDLDDATGAVYTDPGFPDKTVLFFGGSALIWTPESDLDTAFELISDEQGSVTGLHGVPAGSLGGTMKCGTTKSDDGDIAVCGWAEIGRAHV